MPTVVVNGTVNQLTTRQYLAQQAAYFVVTNPTPGTAIAYALQVAASQTANGLFLVQNTNPVGGKNIVLDRLLLHQTATAPTGTLDMRFEAYNETGLVLMTGNVATRTPVQINQGSNTSQVTGAKVQSFAAGAATVPAAVGTRILQGIGNIPTGVTVAYDSFVVDFGADGLHPVIPGNTAARATDPATRVCAMPPIIVAPQSTSWLNMWWVTAATNVPSFEFSLGYAEL